MNAENDMVRYCCEIAVRNFGGGDGVFNAAGFSNALTTIAGCQAAIDGHVVRALLVRPDVVPLHGGGHYRLIWSKP